MRKLSIIFMLAVVSALSSFGQLSGPKIIGSGGDFPTLTAAIAALNTQGVGTGGVTFNIPAGYTETFTDRLNGTIYTNTSTVDKPIIFQKSGEGVNPKITAPPGSTLNADYIILYRWYRLYHLRRDRPPGKSGQPEPNNTDGMGICSPPCFCKRRGL